MATIETGEVYRHTKTESWWFIQWPGEGICCWTGVGFAIGDRLGFTTDDRFVPDLIHVPTDDVPNDISAIIMMVGMDSA